MTVVKPASAPDRDGGREAWVPDGAEGFREWRLDLDLVVLDHPGHHERHRHVEDGADAERRENADRHVTLGILGLLGSRRHDVEPDVGEEHQCGAGEDAADAEGAGCESHVLEQGRRRCRPGSSLGAGRRDERRVVAGLDEEQAREDHEQHDAELDGDHHEVDVRGDLDPETDDARQDQHDHRGDEVVTLPVGPVRDGDADLVHHVGEVRRPADRDRAGSEGQLEDQVPADRPGHEFAEAGIGERVRRAGHRHRAGELGVAERRKCTGDPREHERQCDRRSSLGARGLTGEHEDSGPDDDADTEDRQLQCTELFA